MKSFFSICIPTYNRGQIVYDTVSNILKSDRQDIEVVVSNNCSTDNTEELLLSIKDSRFKYFKNEYNNGADNMISVLTYATGEYLMLLSDEDDVVFQNLDTYIQQLKQFKPAVMFGTSAVDRYRYAYKGSMHIKDCYEALKVLGFGETYLSGYIYNRKIMKKVLGDIYGAEINRKLGYGYNFLDLARRMVQYGSFMAQSEVIASQRTKGVRDMGTHFDGGECAYSPEYRVKEFFDAVNDIAVINIKQRQKYLLLELYKDQIVFDESTRDYTGTFTGKGEHDSRREREFKIAEYYRLNKENVIGIKFYLRLYCNVKKCDKYINNAMIFKKDYRIVKLRYLIDTIKIAKCRYRKLLEFAARKYMLEMES